MRDQIYIFLLTGAETSTILLSNCMLFLAIHQNIQDELYEEITKNLPSIESEITYEVINKMELLDRVVKEGLRLGGPLGITLRLTTGDFDAGPEVFPKGTRLILYNFFIHKRKDIWGQEADSFNPDRFFPENVAKRHPYSFVPYGMVRECEFRRALSSRIFILGSQKLHWTQTCGRLRKNLHYKILTALQVQDSFERRKFEIFVFVYAETSRRPYGVP